MQKLFFCSSAELIVGSEKKISEKSLEMNKNQAKITKNNILFEIFSSDFRVGSRKRWKRLFFFLALGPSWLILEKKVLDFRTYKKDFFFAISEASWLIDFWEKKSFMSRSVVVQSGRPLCIHSEVAHPAAHYLPLIWAMPATSPQMYFQSTTQHHGIHAFEGSPRPCIFRAARKHRAPRHIIYLWSEQCLPPLRKLCRCAGC